MVGQVRAYGTRGEAKLLPVVAHEDPGVFIAAAGIHHAQRYALGGGAAVGVGHRHGVGKRAGRARPKHRVGTGGTAEAGRRPPRVAHAARRGEGGALRAVAKVQVGGHPAGVPKAYRRYHDGGHLAAAHHRHHGRGTGHVAVHVGQGQGYGHPAPVGAAKERAAEAGLGNAAGIEAAGIDLAGGHRRRVVYQGYGHIAGSHHWGRHVVHRYAETATARVARRVGGRHVHGAGAHGKGVGRLDAPARHGVADDGRRGFGGRDGSRKRDRGPAAARRRGHHHIGRHREHRPGHGRRVPHGGEVVVTAVVGGARHEHVASCVERHVGAFIRRVGRPVVEGCPLLLARGPIVFEGGIVGVCLSGAGVKGGV